MLILIQIPFLILIMIPILILILTQIPILILILILNMIPNLILALMARALRERVVENVLEKWIRTAHLPRDPKRKNKYKIRLRSSKT